MAARHSITGSCTCEPMHDHGSPRPWAPRRRVIGNGDFNTSFGTSYKYSWLGINSKSLSVEWYDNYSFGLPSNTVIRVCNPHSSGLSPIASMVKISIINAERAAVPLLWFMVSDWFIAYHVFNTFFNQLLVIKKFRNINQCTQIRLYTTWCTGQFHVNGVIIFCHIKYSKRSKWILTKMTFVTYWSFV